MVLALMPQMVFADDNPGTLEITIEGFEVGKTPKDCTYTFTSTGLDVTFSESDVDQTYWWYGIDNNSYNRLMNDSQNFEAGKKYEFIFYLNNKGLTEAPAITVNGNEPRSYRLIHRDGTPYLIEIVCYPAAPASQKYTITYDGGEGVEGSIEAGTKTHGENFTLSSMTFTRKGFVQTGWATSDGGEKVYDLGGTYTENKDITLYPVWSSDIENPKISGVEDGKTYCSAQTLTVTDNYAIQSVTVNGSAVDLANNQFTLSPASGEQEITATDKAGNRKTVTVTVNNGHTGGTATCIQKSKCGICGEEYGELDSINHTGSMVWEKNETQHKQYWDCCKAVVVNYVDHTWSNGVCSVCDYVCKHTGGEATCTSKATCEYCGEKYGELNSSNHDLENIPAKDATVTETGNKEYWQCTDCQKYFSDATGTNEIKLDDTVISKLSPEIIEGKGQSITAGEKKALSFTSNAAYSDFIRVELDGKTLDEKNYTVKEGSTIVTLNADYVATLPAGEHTIGIVSESGTATTTFTAAEKEATGTTDDSDKDSKSDDEDSAKTGDNTNIVLWLSLMLLSGAGIAGAGVYTRRKRTNE